MTAKRLDGKALANQLRTEMGEQVQKLLADGFPLPKLVVVLVGDNPASHSYVKHKKKACEQIGIQGEVRHLPATTTESELLEIVRSLNADGSVHGILVQLPLPKQISESAVIEAISPAKDVDCFHAENLGKLAVGTPRFYPCTPFGVITLLERNGITLAGKEVVIVGRSNIVGKPLSLMMMQKRTEANPVGCDATVTVAHTRTASLAQVCQRADILIAAAGTPGLIKADMVRPDAVVVDVGTNMVDGKLVGDVDIGVQDVAGWLSPVPGGVGPMTITSLLQNTITAAKLG